MDAFKMSAIVLGFAAANVLAQDAAAADSVATPAAAPADISAEASVEQPAIAVADSANTTERANIAEEASSTGETVQAQESLPEAAQDAAQETVQEAAPVETAQASVEPQTAEEVGTVEEAPKTTEAAPAAEVAQAAVDSTDTPKTVAANLDESATKSDMDLKLSGEVEFDTYVGDVFEDREHGYSTTFDLNLDLKLNEKWSAFVGIEADDKNANPSIHYNGAWVKYQHSNAVSFKLGDVTFSEGAFVSYYGYDDPAEYAAGMKEHDIRGLEVNLAGLQLGIGYARGENDIDADADGRGEAYDLHAAYDLAYAGQHLRPFADYKSYQSTDHNEVHAGVEAGLAIGGFSFRAVYGFHADYLPNDDVLNLTSSAHTILAEPCLTLGIFQMKTAFFYAFVNDNDMGYNEVASDIPEYLFAYAEPSIKFAEYVQVGIPVEFHTRSLDNAKYSTIDAGARIYTNPVENLNLVAFGMVDIPVGVRNEDEDVALTFGLETKFSF